MKRVAIRERLGAFAAAGIVCVLAGLTPSGAVKAADAGGDGRPTLAQEHRALEMVCTQCHSLEMVRDTPRTYESWYQTVIAMYQRGAKGTPRQFAEVLDYLHRTLTVIDVNTADADELQTVLDLPQSVARDIIRRRASKRFTGLADLDSVPGVQPKKLAAKARLIYFH
jgi:Helix-hairpin-helix motif